jgi:hypothetical protein
MNHCVRLKDHETYCFAASFRHVKAGHESASIQTLPGLALLRTRTYTSNSSSFLWCTLSHRNSTASITINIHEALTPKASNRMNQILRSRKTSKPPQTPMGARSSCFGVDDSRQYEARQRARGELRNDSRVRCRPEPRDEGYAMTWPRKTSWTAMTKQSSQQPKRGIMSESQSVIEAATPVVTARYL